MTAPASTKLPSPPDEQGKQLWFSFRISFLYALALFLNIWVDTYMSGMSKSHNKPWPIPECPGGYWLFLVPAFLFVIAFFLLWRSSRTIFRGIAFPVLSVAVTWTMSALNFSPPFPHWFQIFALGLLPLPAVVAFAIRYSPMDKKAIMVEGIPLSAKIEWLKESVSLWRTVALSGAVAFCGFIVSWLNWMWDGARRGFAGVPEEATILSLYAIWAAVLTVYIAFCPLYECLARGNKYRGMFLQLREQPPASTPVTEARGTHDEPQKRK